MKKLVLALSLTLFCSPLSHAHGQFFEGKTAKIIAGLGAGGDRFAKAYFFDPENVLENSDKWIALQDKIFPK